jgi:Flp pilus assembly protein TadG
MRWTRRDEGAVAVIVAICISALLLGVGAVTVDLGMAYVTKDAMRDLADKAATAGASRLPDTAAATQAVEAMVQQGWPAGSPPPAPGWATSSAPGTVALTPTTVSVTLPPATVQFGLASVFGATSVAVSQSSQVRLGTPLGLGILPFPLMQSDLSSSNPLRNRQFCIADTSVAPPVVNPYPGPTSRTYWMTLTPSTMDVNATSRSVQIRPTSPTSTLPTAGTVTVRLSTQVAGIPLTSMSNAAYTFDLPAGVPPGAVTVWFEYRRPSRSTRVSHPAILTMTGTPPVTTSPCVQSGPGRGALALPGPTIAQNIQRGVAPDLVDVGDRVPVTTAGFATALDSGFFASSTGRLRANCGAPNAAGSRGAVDGSSIFQDVPGRLIDQRVGSVSLLAGWLLGTLSLPSNPSGWLDVSAYRCGRFGVMPVIDDSAGSGSPPTYPVVGYRYVWVDDMTAAVGSGDRGFLWSGGNPRGLQGYVLDESIMARFASGSPRVGPYLGGAWPGTAVLEPAP